METSLTTPIDPYAICIARKKSKNAITTAPTTPVTIKPLDIAKPIKDQPSVVFSNTGGMERRAAWFVTRNLPIPATLSVSDKADTFGFMPLPNDNPNPISGNLVYEYKDSNFDRAGFTAELIKDFKEKFGIDLTVQ